MSRAKEASRTKRARKTLPVLGAAGLSLSLASGASIAKRGAVAGFDDAQRRRELRTDPP
jgi:hypothetical protein